MKTAEDFLVKKNYHLSYEFGGLGMYYVREAMIEFAKMHVQEALQSAYDYHTIEKHKKEEMYDYPDIENFRVNKESILNAYSLENIK